MPRLARLVLIVCAALLAVPAAPALAAQRMPIGFFDDISFRFSADKDANLLAAASAGVSVIHTTANWAQMAPTQPADAADPADPAYHLADLDQLVAGAGRYGLRVMINITGTPKWANGGKTPNYLPKSPSTIATFARMLATRYDGRHGLSSVSLWSVWNEPNLQQFLAPQYAGKKIVSAANYAKMFKVVYAAIKSANPAAQVAIGETSAQGRDKPLAGKSATVAPGTFAKLLSKVSGLKFDAWAHHPYPTSPSAKPLELVRYPNVTFSTLPTFEADLKKEFHRSVPVWITEYGHETKPGEPHGVSTSVQAAYAKQALGIAKKDPNIQMFIWFTFRDSAGNPWQSGLEGTTGAHKPAFNAFAALAKKIDGTTTSSRKGTAPMVKIFVPYLGFWSPVGSTIGISYKVLDSKNKVVAIGGPASPLGSDMSVSFKPNFTPTKGTYTIVAVANEINGHTQTRDVTLVVS